MKIRFVGTEYQGRDRHCTMYCHQRQVHVWYLRSEYEFVTEIELHPCNCRKGKRLPPFRGGYGKARRIRRSLARRIRLYLEIGRDINLSMKDSLFRGNAKEWEEYLREDRWLTDAEIERVRAYI